MFVLYLVYFHIFIAYESMRYYAIYISCKFLRFMNLCLIKPVRDNFNVKSHKYVRITTYQPDTKSNRNPNRATKKHVIVNIQLNSYMSYISR